jgi:hypothetical protein
MACAAYSGQQLADVRLTPTIAGLTIHNKIVSLDVQLALGALTV